MALTYFTLGVVTALAVAAAALLALYFYLKSTRHKPPVKGYLDLIPDLTAEQKAAVQDIRHTFLPKVARIRDDLRRERAELAKLLFADPPDRDRIYAIARQILLHQSDLESEVIEHILEEREILSPSQQRRFCEIIVEQFSSGGLGVHDVRGKS
jgi:Spy/CpxP family protein refolding chaperone